MVLSIDNSSRKSFDDHRGGGGGVSRSPRTISRRKHCAWSRKSAGLARVTLWAAGKHSQILQNLNTVRAAVSHPLSLALIPYIVLFSLTVITGVVYNTYCSAFREHYHHTSLVPTTARGIFKAIPKEPRNDQAILETLAITAKEPEWSRPICQNRPP